MSLFPRQSGPLPRGGVHLSSRLLARQAVLVSVTLKCGEGGGAGIGNGRLDGTAASNGAAASDVSPDPSPGLWPDGWVASRVTDVSREGCGLVSPLAIVPGMTLCIMFPGFEARYARVVWAESDAAGCAFTTPLPAAVLDYLIRMSDPAARG